MTNYRNIPIACNYKNLIQLLALTLLFSHVIASQMVQLHARDIIIVIDH